METKKTDVTKSEALKIRVRKDQKDMIQYMCEQNGLTMSAYILMLVTRDFNSYQFRKGESSERNY